MPGEEELRIYYFCYWFTGPFELSCVSFLVIEWVCMTKDADAPARFVSMLPLHLETSLQKSVSWTWCYAEAGGCFGAASFLLGDSQEIPDRSTRYNLDSLQAGVLPERECPLGGDVVAGGGNR